MSLLHCVMRNVLRGFSKYQSEVILVVTAGVAFVAIWPFGEYALLDDWAYVLSLRHLHQNHELLVMDWNPMTLIGHLLWGELFVALLGLSFSATKSAVGVAGVVCVIAFHSFLRRANVQPSLALLSAAALLLNPLYLFHTTVYMTDITSLMFVWLTAVCWSRAFLDPTQFPVATIVLGSISAGLAYLTRQHGIVLPLAFIGYAAINDQRLLNLKSLSSVLLPCGFLVLFGSFWLSLSKMPHSAFNTAASAISSFCLEPPWYDIPYIIWCYAVYTGLFVGPVVLATIRIRPHLQVHQRWFVLIPPILFGAGYWCYLTYNGAQFPFIRNVITKWGFFKQNEFVVGNRPSLWENGIAEVIAEAGIVGSCGLVWLVAGVRRNKGVITVSLSSDKKCERRSMRCFVSILFALQATYVIVTSPIIFDRHLLILAPTAIALAATHVNELVVERLPLIALWLGIYASYGIVCGHDVHAVSREVFLAGEDLRNQGIPVERIDAGYAFDGWNMYETSQREMPTKTNAIRPWWPTSRKTTGDAEGFQPWWIAELMRKIDPEYVVTISTPVPNNMYGGYRSAPIPCPRQYQTYWPFRMNRIYIFRRELDGMDDDG